MARGVGGRLTSSAIFARAARSYWFEVYPQVCREIGAWHDKAHAIPDDALRDFALTVHSTKRGNLDGAAAFAAFTVPAYRPTVVRAQVAFQAIYDYVDNVAEQPVGEPINNGRRLHQALLVALDPRASHLDYYAYNEQKADAGYLAEIVDVCRGALVLLPSYPAVVGSMRTLAKRIVFYQSFNLSAIQGDQSALENWAIGETPPHARLCWWETAASAGSSLGVFALIAMASRRGVSRGEAATVERAYFPWIGSLHSLLDSLIDLPEDTAAGQRSLIAHYASEEEMATRMRLIALEAIRRCGCLPGGAQHALVLAGMICFYLSAKEARLPHAHQTRSQVLDALGGLAYPSMLVLSLRRVIRSLYGSS
jgi:tetraprenyl-beta-curcumene synthase